MEQALDRASRPLRDLRISVTDRCNFRCTYCMPREAFGREHAFLPRAELLSFEELARLARLAVDLGVRKIRLTGGEPLLRPELERLVALLGQLDVEVTLTTNASLLAARAERLREAGLERITVSLDALDDATFRAMTDADLPVAQVLAGIEAARALGFALKINCVVRRDVNEDEILPLAAFCREHGYTLRLIEYMDVGTTNGWRRDEVVPASVILARLQAVHALEPLEPRYRGEVARRYGYRDGGGEIGLIASVSNPFCGDCTRLRLSADGKLFTCLFATRGHDLRQLLRAGADDGALSAALAGVWAHRDDRYSELRAQADAAPRRRVEMSYIGG